MMQRRTLLGGIAGLAIGTAPGLSTAAPPSVPASERLNALGPEMDAVASRVGLWDVTETVWAAPGAKPSITTGLVAERSMMGSLMQEVIRPFPDVAPHAVARVDLLTFNRVEGIWQYVSFDTRFPVGLMPAASVGAFEGGDIHLVFAPFAVLLPGPSASGQLLNMTQTIRLEGPDHDVKDQYFMEADGTGRSRLAHRYTYRRRA